MKTLRFVPYVLLVLALIVYVSCKKSGNSDSPGGDPGMGTTEYVTATISGRVVDDANVPVKGAVISAGALTTTTDVNGSFSISNVSLAKNAGFVKAEKDGFFQGSRTLTVNASATNYVNIQLIKKTVAGTISTTAGGNVTVPSGGSISFPGNSIINASTNASYSGNVSVNAYFINPASSNFNDIMPGSLRAVNGNQVIGLKSYGMMVVELTGASGEKLQLASGKQATITFPIATILQAQAPASIPLWHFNDTTGLWIQEGTATKQGTDYVGTVSHFSFWNCDAPFQTVFFKATLNDQNNNPIRFKKVELSISGDTLGSTIGYTDSTGVISGAVPSGQIMKMTVYNSCGAIIDTRNIGPYTAATDAGTITINTATPLSTTVTGTVLDCSGNLVANGMVNIAVSGKNYRTLLSNGGFSITVDRCDNSTVTAKLQAFDYNTTQQGAETSLTISGGAVNAGQLSACGSSINEFINYTLNGKQVVLIPPADNLNESRTNSTTGVSGYHSNQSNYTYFAFTDNAQPATVAMDSVNIEGGQYTWKKSGVINVNITEYGPVSGYISGNFSGNLTDKYGTGSPVVPITCTFRVKRKS